jgi:hypothetical protein
MSDKDLEWHCHARDSNLRLSVQEIASPCGAMSAHGPILLKKSEYRPDPIFSAPWVRFSNADAGASSSPSDSRERVLNRSAAVNSVDRGCRSYFGRFATTLHLGLFQPNGDIHAGSARYFLKMVADGNDRYLTVNMTYLSYFRHLSLILSAKSSGNIPATDGESVHRRSALTIKAVLLPTSSDRFFQSTNTLSRSRPTWPRPQTWRPMIMTSMRKKIDSLGVVEMPACHRQSR